MVFSCVQAPREDRLRAFKLEWKTVSHGVTCSGVCYRCSEAMDRQTLAVTSWRGHVFSASSLVLASPCPPAPSAVPPPDPSRACSRVFSRASRTSGRSRNHGRRPHAASIDRMHQVPAGQARSSLESLALGHMRISYSANNKPAEAGLLPFCCVDADV